MPIFRRYLRVYHGCTWCPPQYCYIIISCLPVVTKGLPFSPDSRQHSFFYFLFFFHLTYTRWTSSLPSCLWSQRIFPSLPGSRLTFFLSRCEFSTLTTTRLSMVEFYLLTFPRFPLRKKEHKNPTLVRIELTTSVLSDVQLTN